MDVFRASFNHSFKEIFNKNLKKLSKNWLLFHFYINFVLKWFINGYPRLQGHLLVKLILNRFLIFALFFVFYCIDVCKGTFLVPKPKMYKILAQ